MHDAMVREKIDEAADLRRQMMAMRINRVHRPLHRAEVRRRRLLSRFERLAVRHR